VVLLGAYKEPANVKQLTNKLKQMGLPSFSEHFDSPQGPRTRVRAGPFKARDAAEKALARIKTIGVDGQVAQSK
jgi:DedD protein